MRRLPSLEMLKREVDSPRSMAVWATPILASSSSVFAWMPTALVCGMGCSALSIRRQRIARRSRSLASVRPTGPGPTTRTSGVAAVGDTSLIFLHPFVWMLVTLWQFDYFLVILLKDLLELRRIWRAWRKLSQFFKVLFIATRRHHSQDPAWLVPDILERMGNITR